MRPSLVVALVLLFLLPGFFSSIGIIIIIFFIGMMMVFNVVVFGQNPRFGLRITFGATVTERGDDTKDTIASLFPFVGCWCRRALLCVVLFDETDDNTAFGLRITFGALTVTEQSRFRDTKDNRIISPFRRVLVPSLSAETFASLLFFLTTTKKESTKSRFL